MTMRARLVQRTKLWRMTNQTEILFGITWISACTVRILTRHTWNWLLLNRIIVPRRKLLRLFPQRSIVALLTWWKTRRFIASDKTHWMIYWIYRFRQQTRIYWIEREQRKLSIHSRSRRDFLVVRRFDRPTGWIRIHFLFTCLFVRIVFQRFLSVPMKFINGKCPWSKMFQVIVSTFFQWSPRTASTYSTSF